MFGASAANKHVYCLQLHSAHSKHEQASINHSHASIYNRITETTGHFSYLVAPDSYSGFFWFVCFVLFCFFAIFRWLPTSIGCLFMQYLLRVVEAFKAAAHYRNILWLRTAKLESAGCVWWKSFPFNREIIFKNLQEEPQRSPGDTDVQ